MPDIIVGELKIQMKNQKKGEKVSREYDMIEF